MDPVSHLSLGRTLVAVLTPRALGDRPVRGSVAAGVLGTLAPDVDAIFMLAGWDVYLRVHEIGTHSLPGNAASALLTAAVVRPLARGSSYPMLFVFAWIGALSHIALDLLSSARLRPGWPVIDTVVSLPVVAMADPWLLVFCASGPLAIWYWNRTPKQAAAVALACTVIFVALKGVAGVWAFGAYRTARDVSHERVDARVIEAKWASLGAWRVLDRTPTRLRVWQTSIRGPAIEILSWPLDNDTEPIRVSRFVHRPQLSPRASSRICRRASAGRRWVARAVVGPSILLGSDEAERAGSGADPSDQRRQAASRLRVVVWRRSRRTRSARPRDRHDRRIHADARGSALSACARFVSTNSTFANGVPSPVAFCST
jgi:membrane-bound metal-dependent hydrolase YbcI (DUF457 family)